MAVVRDAVERIKIKHDVHVGEAVSGDVDLEPCGLLVADPMESDETAMTLSTIWASRMEVNPEESFEMDSPTTILEITAALLTPAAAAKAVARSRATNCPTGEFELRIGLASARRTAGSIQIGPAKAQLTAATVRKVNPDIGLNLLPGNVRLIFNDGPLLFSIEVLAFQSRKLNTAAQITRYAQDIAVALAADIMKNLADRTR